MWGIYRGLIHKAPMLQDASPIAALVIAFFEFTFYWCISLRISSLLDLGWQRMKRSKAS